jgi:NAD(P)-dependent dehydrogenase (short-subunit alcohol dehydrogenase family)
VVAKIEATNMLRPGLLAGASIVLARDARAAAPELRAALGSASCAVCTKLGARVFECSLASTGNIEADDAATAQAVARALAELGEVSLLLVDSASAFASERGRNGAGADADAERSTGPDAGAAGLVGALEASWRITQAVANAAFIERGAPGRIVYVAPRPDEGIHADAARAGLENLARTLSIEWARYGVTSLAIAPGVGTSAAEIAALTGYLASPAGDYFSGCLLDLRGARQATRAPGR